MTMMSNKDISYLINKRMMRFSYYKVDLDMATNDVVKNKNLDIEPSIFNHFDEMISFDSKIKGMDVNEVLKKLESDYYCLTDEDIKVLRDNYIFVGGSRKIAYKGDASFIVIRDEIVSPRLMSILEKAFGSIYVMGSSKSFSVKHYNDLVNIKRYVDMYPDKVKYVPCAGDFAIVAGWHDLYDPRAVNQYDAEWAFYYANLVKYEKELRGFTYEQKKEFLRNVGAITEYDEELVEWLSLQPIQRVHNKDDIRYCLASNFFDQELMNFKSDCCLKDYIFDFDLRPEMNDVIGYDFESKYYDPTKCPKDDAVLFVVNYPDDKSMSLYNSDGKRLPLIHVENGMGYDGKDIKRVLSDVYLEPIDEVVQIYTNKILSHVIENGSDAFDKCDWQYGIDSYEDFDAMEIIGGNLSGADFDNLEDYSTMMKKVVVLDIIINNSDDSETLIGEVDSYLTDTEKSVSDISGDVDTLFLIDTLGRDNIREVLEAYGFESVADYYQDKFGKGNKSDGKTFGKK